jgi:colanic acid/amylovoran biosynthesis glycosyltransferase
MKPHAYGEDTQARKSILSVAFVVGVFPATSETFIINQVADLIDRGVDVRIFSLSKGSEDTVSDRYTTYRMKERVVYLTPPKNIGLRLCMGAGIALRMLFTHPRILFRALNMRKYGAVSKSLKLLFWVFPFLDTKFDLIHCHMGTVATKYLTMRSVLGQTTKFVTTFYGYDVSRTPQQKGIDCYRDLALACDLFFVMSENMKSRVLPLGVPQEKIVVHPISIDVESYEFNERTLAPDETVQITSVGRFVEKKGFDDLLRAIAVVKKGAKRPFRLSIVGDGELHDEIHSLAKELDVTDVVDFKGYMKLEDVLSLYGRSHLYVQASKTAKDGDME